MITFSPEQLQVWSSGRWACGVPAAINGFSIDTRTVKPGEMFLALGTAKRDGHDYLDAARAAGASCALVSREVPSSGLPQLVVGDVLESFQRIAAVARERFRAPVIGVTGSVGKTSTKDLLKRLLGGEAAHATHANLNNLIGVPLTLLAADPARHSAMVVEAGMSEPGELERSAWVIRPDVALVTNVQPAHLEGLGSMEAIAREKSALCRQTSARGVAVFPADCLKYDAFRRLLGRRIVVAFEGDLEPAPGAGLADVVRVRISPTGAGHLLSMASGTLGSHSFRLGPVSEGMARNGALAAVAALQAGVAPASIADVLAAWTPSAGRGEVREIEGRSFYIDCYNASPASMADAARCFVRRTPDAQPRLFVLGGMNELGADAVALHRSVGLGLPLRSGDTLALYGGLSSEIGVGAIEAGFPAPAIRHFETIEALREAVHAFPGSVMLKGSRGYALERALPVVPGHDAQAH